MTTYRELELVALELSHGGAAPGQLCSVGVASTPAYEDGVNVISEGIKACFVHRSNTNAVVETILKSTQPTMSPASSSTIRIADSVSGSFHGSALNEVEVDLPDIRKLMELEMGAWFRNQHPKSIGLYFLTTNTWGSTARSEFLTADALIDSNPIWYCLLFDPLTGAFIGASVNGLNRQVLFTTIGVLPATFLPLFSWTWWQACKVAVIIVALLSMCFTVGAAIPAVTSLSSLAQGILIALESAAVVAGVLRSACAVVMALIGLLLQLNSQANASAPAKWSAMNTSLKAIEARLTALTTRLETIDPDAAAPLPDLQEFKALGTELVRAADKLKEDVNTSTDLSTEEKTTMLKNVDDIREAASKLKDIGE